MTQPKFYIIEGIDRVGKDTVIDKLSKTFMRGNPPIDVFHYSAPSSDLTPRQARIKQRESFIKGWKRVFDRTNEKPVIYNRFHLGETVYGPRYRGLNSHDIDMIFDDEEYWLNLIRAETNYDVRLILLATSNFDHLEDDGESFDWSAKEQEQNDFITAWGRSRIKKKIIDTSDIWTDSGYQDINRTMDCIFTGRNWF